MRSDKSSLRPFLIIVVCLLCCLSVTAVGAQDDKRLYQWTDDQGIVHVTDNLQNVPQKYRPRATQIGQPASGEVRTGGQESRGTAAGNDAVPAAGNEDQQKAHWQQRMIDAKLELQFAEEKSRQLEQRKSELQSKWGSSGAALPPQEAIDEMNQIGAELSRAQQEVDRARNVVNTVIPDEARRAGVPPGWLREVE